MNKEKTWTKYVKRRIEQNKNFNCAITGATGSGKSYAALSWAEELDASFSADRVVFTPREFMELMNKGNLKPGNVILFDEIGVAMNSKQHMTAVNRALNFCFQTYRHRNLTVFMTTPHLAFLDSTVRRLLHAHGVTTGINYKKKVSKLKLYSIEVDQQKGKLYRKYLRLKKNSRVMPITRVLFRYPSLELAQAYEEKKKAFTTALNKRLLGILEKAEEKELGKQKRIVLTDAQNLVLEGIKAGKNLRLIAREQGINTASVSVHKRALEKKGFTFKIVDANTSNSHYKVIEEPKGRVMS